ncbi:SMI1/KNR4 family protein [Archangium lansingense]|uniref:SMI1/KNR4 family protein n=1 Tax=Archangium lansingense TaxID=2995310 RepID=A0ABT3ZU92_9BACT|nr:SMI1/KNR4 family protein [Archangium lansinium]MCY1072974.1 SMI1/KNR4 family protein [Archangium lansinium]
MRDLIEFIRQYDPEYPSKIRGASADETVRLAQLVGRALPAHYKEFLLHLGKDMGDLQMPETDFRIGRVLKFYELGKKKPPTRFIFIGAQVEDPYDRYLLDCGDGQHQDCPVLRADPQEPFKTTDNLWVSFPSLKDMLFVLAFDVKRMGLMPHRRQFTPSFEEGKDGLSRVPPGLMDSVEKVLARLGFEKQPYTSELNPLFERGDAAFYASRNPEGGGMTAQLAAQDEREFKKLIEIIRDNTALL